MSTLSVVELVEGWTGPIDFDLLADDATPDSSMDGMTVELILTDQSGEAIEVTGTVEVADADLWRVRYTPGDELEAGKYSARFKITDGGGKVVYFPNGPADRWVVRTP